MTSFKLIARLTVCLASTLSSSCASSVPTSTPNYSEVLRQEVALQKATDCGALSPDPIPASILERLKLIPPELHNRSPDQVALNDWLNHATAQAEKRSTYCAQQG